MDDDKPEFTSEEKQLHDFAEMDAVAREFDTTVNTTPGGVPYVWLSTDSESK